MREVEWLGHDPFAYHAGRAAAIPWGELWAKSGGVLFASSDDWQLLDCGPYKYIESAIGIRANERSRVADSWVCCYVFRGALIIGNVSVRTRESNNPKRRIAPCGSLSDDDRLALANKAVYVGSAHHKRTPGDYGFQPPINPRPSKSLCDDLIVISKAEACQLLKDGIRKGLVSSLRINESLPKYVWSVDQDRHVFEAKLGADGYHGYRLDREQEKDMHDLVLTEWDQR